MPASPQILRKPDPDAMLNGDMGRLALSMYDFVMYAYPWEKPGSQLERDLPDVWQVELMRDIDREVRRRNFNGHDPVMPIQVSRTTGHGVGKSAFTGWAADWIMSTRPMSKGVVSANTNVQLETKTWAEIVKWTRMCVTNPWWHITSGRGSMRMARTTDRENWRLDGMAWDATKPEAFAGLHAANASPFFIFDEASAIPEVILETAQGGLTDGEPFMFMWSQPTRPSGYFYNTFHKWRNLWLSKRIDSRTARKTNKALIEQWRDQYGEDSAYFRIRVKGEFPSQGADQYMPTDLVEHAMRRPFVSPQPTDPIIFGVDVARKHDFSTIYIRQGFDCRSHPPIRIPGSQDPTHLAQLASTIASKALELVPDAIFVDETGIGAGVVEMLHMRQIPRVMGVNFAMRSPARGYHDRVAWMWGRAREWLQRGGCLPQLDELKEDLISREYFLDNNNAIMLEPKDDMKLRIGRSPDDADGFCLTFGDDVGPRDPFTTMGQLAGHDWRTRHAMGDFDPYAQE